MNPRNELRQQQLTVDGLKETYQAKSTFEPHFVPCSISVTSIMFWEIQLTLVVFFFYWSRSSLSPALDSGMKSVLDKLLRICIVSDVSDLEQSPAQELKKSVSWITPFNSFSFEPNKGLFDENVAEIQPKALYKHSFLKSGFFEHRSSGIFPPAEGSCLSKRFF